MRKTDVLMEAWCALGNYSNRAMCQGIWMQRSFDEVVIRPLHFLLSSLRSLNALRRARAHSGSFLHRHLPRLERQRQPHRDRQHRLLSHNVGRRDWQQTQDLRWTHRFSAGRVLPHQCQDRFR